MLLNKMHCINYVNRLPDYFVFSANNDIGAGYRIGVGIEESRNRSGSLAFQKCTCMRDHFLFQRNSLCACVFGSFFCQVPIK
ncbi:unnamed protein product [Arctogadus glacialis]